MPTNITPKDPRPCMGRHRGQADACTGPESCGLPFATHRGDKEARKAAEAWGLGHSLALNGSSLNAAESIGREAGHDLPTVEAGWKAGVKEHVTERQAKAAARRRAAEAEKLLSEALAVVRQYQQAGASSEGAHFWEDYDQAGIRAADLLKRTQALGVK